MGKRDQSGAENFEESDEEHFNAEFDSMVEGLSLDASSPTTYLDELDAFEDHNRFTPPPIPKRGFKSQIRDAIRAVSRWKNNHHNDHPEDGATL